MRAIGVSMCFSFLLGSVLNAQATFTELVSSAERHEARREHAQAIADYDQLLKLRPGWSDGYNRRGAEHFKMAHIEQSLTDFDHAIELDPAQAPYHWQRGISLFYAGRYEDGRKQFELHQTVNGNDVENAAWRFLCIARAGTMASARASLMPIQHDARVPMMEIYALYRGTGGVDQVLRAARAGDPSPTALNEHLFYAYLYLGLYYEAAGDAKAAREHISRAVAHMVDHYMGDVARVHLQLQKP